MRILQANKYHYAKGGAERYYLDVSRALAARGHEVVPFAMQHPRNEETPHARHFVPEIDYRSRLSLGARLRAAARAIYSRETVRRVRALVADTHPQIAHLHNIYHQLSPSLITELARCGTPIVQTLHDYNVVCPGSLFMAGGEVCEECKGGRYHRMLGQRCLLESRGASAVGAIEAYLHNLLKTYAKVDRFLCPSRFMLEKVAEFGLPREKLIHLPYFLRLESYLPAFRESDYFIYLGRLSREKGIVTLFDALRLRGGGRLRCRILGEGPIEGELRTRAREWGLGGVEFTGYLQGEALHEAIRNAAFTVVPSEWYENLPFSVLESFALGTPVVGAQIGGIPEMVLDGETGWTFRSGDAPGLAEKLAWMEAHPERVVALGRGARTLVEERYAPGPHLDRLEEIYGTLISGRPGRPEAPVAAAQDRGSG
ncbi:MAG: glycosyltransferase [Candidatus Eisenbacteria bacterium]|nr:glycosyltransferase [Candidatus Eisenbacteria bacterium]